MGRSGTLLGGAAVALLAGVAVVDTYSSLGLQTTYAGPRLPSAVLAVLVVSTLAWCRRRPVLATAWVSLLLGLSRPVWPHDLQLVTGFFVLIAVMAVAGYECRSRWAVVSLVIGWCSIAVGTLYTGSPSATAVAGNVLFATPPWVAAVVLRRRERDAAAMGEEVAAARAEAGRQLEEAAQEERARIARELHDVVAHAVSVMVVQSGAARSVLDQDTAQASEALLAAERTGRDALVELRRMLGVMRSADLTGPLAPPPSPQRLDELVATVRATGRRVEVDVDLGSGDLPEALGITIHRIVQESLTNAVRYAGDGVVTVRVHRSDGAVDLEVTSPLARGSAARPETGHGLLGMAERARLFGGTFEAAPDRDRWRVVARLPLPEDLQELPTTGVLEVRG